MELLKKLVPGGLENLYETISPDNPESSSQLSSEQKNAVVVSKVSDAVSELCREQIGETLSNM